MTIFGQTVKETFTLSTGNIATITPTTAQHFNTSNIAKQKQNFNKWIWKHVVILPKDFHIKNLIQWLILPHLVNLLKSLETFIHDLLQNLWLQNNSLIFVWDKSRREFYYNVQARSRMIHWKSNVSMLQKNIGDSVKKLNWDKLWRHWSSLQVNQMFQDYLF